MWKDEGQEFDLGSIPDIQKNVSTLAGKYYCGHSPCETGDNYPYGGNWLGKKIISGFSSMFNIVQMVENYLSKSLF